MPSIKEYKKILAEQERKKKQANNKFNVCKEKAGDFDSAFEKITNDNLIRMQKYYDFEFSFHTPEESIHWYTYNKWNKRYGYIGLTKDDICNDKIHHLYEPDFIIDLSCGHKFYIETKGHFPATDRTKMKAIKKLYPELDIRMLFMKVQKLQGLSYTNVEWCEKNGFPCHTGNLLPKEWFKR